MLLVLLTNISSFSITDSCIKKVFIIEVTKALSRLMTLFSTNSTCGSPTMMIQWDARFTECNIMTNSQQINRNNLMPKVDNNPVNLTLISYYQHYVIQYDTICERIHKKNMGTNDSSRRATMLNSLSPPFSNNPLCLRKLESKSLLSHTVYSIEMSCFYRQSYFLK